jgi:glycosyltransferase involved in cell wall biosynthesis
VKILLVVHTFFPEFRAGTEVYTLECAKELARRSHEVAVLTWEPSHADGDAVTLRSDSLDGVRVHRLSFQRPRRHFVRDEYMNPTVTDYLQGFYAAQRPDVIHVMHSMHLSAATLRAARGAGIPVVATATDFWYVCPTFQLYRHDGKLCRGPSDPVTCLRCYVNLHPTLAQKGYRALIFSPLIRIAFLGARVGAWIPLPWVRQGLGQIRTLVDRARVLRDTVHSAVRVLFVSSEFARSLFIENGFDASILRVSSLAIDHGWATRNKTPSDRVRFGYIGTLSEAKGAHILIEAFRGIPLGDAADLAIYGAPAHHRQYFEGLQAAAGQDPRIQFRGTFPKEDLNRVFQGIDVLVVPSIWYDNMPLVIHAALATGTPVIASDLGGLSSVVDEGVNGLLFPCGSAGALRERMLACVRTPGLLARLREGAKPVRAISEAVDELLDTYRSLVAQ